MAHPGAADPRPRFQRFHAHQIKRRLMKQMADVIMASATQKAKDAIEEAGQHNVRHWHSQK